VFPTAGEGGEAYTLLGPLEEARPVIEVALSNGPNRVSVSFPSSEDGNIQFPKRCLLFRIQEDGQSPHTHWLCLIHNSQDILDSTSDFIYIYKTFFGKYEAKITAGKSKHRHEDSTEKNIKETREDIFIYFNGGQ
jgi:hypothetical protein